MSKDVQEQSMQSSMSSSSEMPPEDFANLEHVRRWFDRRTLLGQGSYGDVYKMKRKKFVFKLSRMLLSKKNSLSAMVNSNTLP
jgi:hypothetical protein